MSSPEAGLELGEPWRFDAEVAAGFDGYLSRSIPGASEMRRIVTGLALRYARRGTTVLDLGCAGGGSLAPIIEARGDWLRYLGVEASEPMVEATRTRFGPLVEEGTLTVTHANLKGWFPDVEPSVVLAVLTLQFVPIEFRYRVVRDAYRSLLRGGAMLLVEKVLGSSADVDEALVELYYERKREAGFSDGEINRKRLSLEGVLVPLTATGNEDLLRSAGFTAVEVVWRTLNFAGWLALKA